MSDVTRDGENLIKQYLRGQEGVRRSKANLNQAECDANNTETALAKWLMPSDMKPGEKIAVWYSDTLFQVELFASGATKVTVRTRGKHFNELAAA